MTTPSSVDCATVPVLVKGLTEVKGGGLLWCGNPEGTSHEFINSLKSDKPVCYLHVPKGPKTGVESVLLFIGVHCRGGAEIGVGFWENVLLCTSLGRKIDGVICYPSLAGWCYLFFTS